MPIPFSDVYPLSSIEFILFSSLLGIYGHNLNKTEIINILKSFGSSSDSVFWSWIGTSFQLIRGEEH